MSGMSIFQKIYFYSRKVINNEVPQNKKNTGEGVDCMRRRRRQVCRCRCVGHLPAMTNEGARGCDDGDDDDDNDDGRC